MPGTAARPTCVTAAGLLLSQDGVEPVEFLRAAGETGNARRDADKRAASSALRPLGCRTALGRREDAALAFFGIGDADEILINDVGKEASQRRILATQDDDVALLFVLQPLGLEARELFPV